MIPLKMKKYILSAILVFNIVLTACSSNEEESSINKKKGFELTGRFTKVQGINKVELTELSLGGIKLVDSTQIDEKGIFKFSGKGSIPKFYMLRYNNNGMHNIPLYLDSTTHVELLIDPENKDIPYTVKGDLNNSEMQYYYVKNNESYKEISETYSKFKGGNVSDSLKESFQLQMQSLFDARAKNLQNLIKSREQSAAAIFCAYYLLPPSGNSAEQSMEILQSYLKEFEEFYMDIDKKYYKKYGNEPAFSMIHSYMKAQMSTAIGTEMEDFTLNNPEGNPMSLKSLRGKYVLVDFWASWCRPCRAENPNVVKAYNKFHEKGFEILGVSLDTDPNKWKAAIKSDGLVWNHVSELKAWDAEIARKFNVSSIPFSVLVDKEGKIIAKNLRGELLDQKLQEVLGE